MHDLFEVVASRVLLFWFCFTYTLGGVGGAGWTYAIIRGLGVVVVLVYSSRIRMAWTNGTTEL